MPLEILLVLVVGGIAGVALLIRVLGMSVPLRFDTEAEVRRHWLRHFPDEAPRAVHISADGAVALVETADGGGLLWAMGADSTAHRLDGATLKETPDGLGIAFHDFGAPGLTVRLAAADRADWKRLVADLAAPHPPAA